MSSKRARQLAGKSAKPQLDKQPKQKVSPSLSLVSGPPVVHQPNSPVLKTIDIDRDSVEEKVSTNDVIDISPAYYIMLQRWLALEATLIYRRRPQPFRELKSAIETNCGYEFNLFHFGQFLTLWPNCYSFKKISYSNDQNYPSNRLGNGSSTEIYIEISHGENDENNEITNKNPTVQNKNNTQDNIPSHGGLLLESTILNRQKRIEDIIIKLFHQNETSEKSLIILTGNKNDSEEREDQRLDIKSIDIIELLKQKDIETENDKMDIINHPPFPKKAKLSSPSSPSSLSSTTMETKNLNSDSKLKEEQEQEEEEEEEENNKSRFEAIRNRIIARERSDQLVEIASGGKEGRRKNRLLSLLPSFCDCLHSYLIQRRANTLQKDDLILGVSKRFPSKLPRNEIDELLVMISTFDVQWYRVFIAPPSIGRVKPIEMIQFNGSVKYSQIRKLAILEVSTQLTN